MSIANIYVKTFRQGSGKSHPIWPPIERVQVGDYGIYKDGSFDKKGNIGDIDIAFTTKTIPQPGNISLSEGISYQFNPEGVVDMCGASRASLSIRTEKENTAFIHIVFTEASLIEDLRSVEEQIMKKFKKKTWRRDWIVITEVAYSSNFVTVVNQSGQAYVTFNCETDLPEPSFESASLKFSISHNQNSSYHCCTGSEVQQCTPMFKARQIKGYFNPDICVMERSTCCTPQHLSDSQKEEEMKQYDEDMEYQFEDL